MGELTYRKKWLSIFVAFVACIVCFTMGIVMALDKNVSKAKAEVDLSAYVDTYDVLYNSDWTVYSFASAWDSGSAMGSTYSTSSSCNYYYFKYTQSSTNTTGSFIWKFKYTPTAAGRFIIYGLTNANSRGNTYIDANVFTAGNTYDVELCVLKLQDSDSYDVFIVVDGVKKVTGNFASTLKQGNDIFIDKASGGYGEFAEPTDFADYADYYVDTYDVLYNSDWLYRRYASAWDTTAGTVMGDDFAIESNYLYYTFRFTQSSANTTGSFIWKFQYTPTVVGTLNLYTLTSWNSRTEPYYDINALCGFEAGNTYDVKICVLKQTNDSGYDLVVIVDGVIKMRKPAPTTVTGYDIFIGNSGSSGTISYEEGTAISDKLTNSDWTNNTSGGTLPDSWGVYEGSDAYLTYAPSDSNSTSSYVWEFDYTTTTVGSGVTVYPFANGDDTSLYGEVIATPGNLTATTTDASKYYCPALSCDATGAKEVHVRVKNNNDTPVNFYLTSSWTTASNVYDENGDTVSLSDNYIIPAKSGWLTYVFEGVSSIDMFVLAKMNASYGVTYGALDITVESITAFYESPVETRTIYDFRNDISQVSSEPGFDVAYSTTERALQINLTDVATASWMTLGLNAPYAPEYTTAHVLIKNDTNARIGFNLNWVNYTSVDSGDASKMTSSNPTWAPTCILPDSGWVEVVFTYDATTGGTYAAMLQNLKIVLVDEVTEGALYIKEISVEDTYVASTDFSNDISQVSAILDSSGATITSGVATSYSATERALAIDFSGFATGTWANFKFATEAVSGVTEAHLFVKNTTNSRIAIPMNWNAYSSVASGDSSMITTMWGATTILANSGWVELVYTVDETSIGSLNIAIESAVTSGALYIGMITVNVAKEATADAEITAPYLSAIDLGNYFTEANTTYRVEIGAIADDDILTTGYNYYIKIDGTTVYSTFLSLTLKNKVGYGDGLFIAFDGEASGTITTPAEDTTTPGESYEYYDLLNNQDWTVDGESMTETWTMENDKYISFTPSAENTTGSFIWQFTYTHNASSDIMYIYPLANGSWGGGWLNDGSVIDIIDLTQCEFVDGSTYEVQIGVIKLTNSDLYEAFVNVNGEKKFTKKGTKADDADRFGLYFYFTDGANGTCVSYLEDTSPYEYYDVLDNVDFGLSQVWDLTQMAYFKFTPSAENTSGSFVWKFTYNQSVAPTATNVLFPLTAGTGGNGADYIDLTALGLGTNEDYEVELGALKLKDTDESYYIYIKVDGETKQEKTITRAHHTNCSSWGCTDLSNHTGIYIYLNDSNHKATFTGSVQLVYPDPVAPSGDYVDTYDVLYNVDWVVNAVTNDGTLTLANDLFLSFTPSETNTTGSFIWKFNYTHDHDDGGDMYIYPLANGSWGGGWLNANGNVDIMLFSNGGFEVGNTYEVELGVLKIDGTDADYYTYISVDGETKFTKTGTKADTANRNGLYLYFKDPDETGSLTSSYGTCTQAGYVVEANGEKSLVNSSVTVTVADVVGESELLSPTDKPDGYTTTWYDQDGNVVTASTTITSNMSIAPTYTYTYTIASVDGETLHTYTHTYGYTASFNEEALTVDTTTFVGYLVGGILYDDLAEAIDVSAQSGEKIIAKTVTLGLFDGASIRLNGEPSIRFTATIDKSEADEGTQIINFGMLLTTKDVLDDITEFTIDGLSAIDSSLYHNLDKDSGLRYVENDDYPGQYVYSLVLEKVSASKYNLQYVARAYAEIQYTDGTSEIIYSEFDKDAHVRSMYEVASTAIDHTSIYTADQLAIIQKHIDGIIDLADSLDGTLEGKDRNYTVSVANNNDGTYTVTITAKNGFDISGIGAIYVAGEKVPVYNANLSAGTFVINEGDMSTITLKKFNEAFSTYTANRELVINAYSGPSLGLKVNSSGAWVNSGYAFTLADLETYMAAGFDAWRLEISPYTSLLGYAANGTVISGGSANKDIYLALDLAAQYAQKYGKPCKIYVNIPQVTGLVVDETAAIQSIYAELTEYDDGISGRNGVPSPVNGKNQIAGFLLKDEPTLSDATNFETIFDYLNDTCGAGAAGYDYQIALLQSYAGESNIGSSFETYVTTYAEILSGIDSVGFDSYPFGYKYVDKPIGTDTTEYTFKDAWFSLLERYSALDNGYTTCIQTYTAGQTTTSSWGTKTTTYNLIQYEAEISMQTYIALAYGYTNLDYFTYGDRIDYDKQVTAEIYQDVPVQWNNYSDWTQGYTLKSMYGWIQNTNAEAISLYDVLGKFTRNGVQLITGSTTNSIFGSATTTNTTNAIGVTSTYDMVVGGFTCGDYNGYLAVNAGLPTKGNGTTTASFTLGTSYTKAIVYVDGEARVERITDGVLTMNIGLGEGVFIIPLA